MTGSKVEINLICANAETSNDQQVLCFAKDTLIQFGLGTNADDVHVPVKYPGQIDEEPPNQGGTLKTHTGSCQPVDPPEGKFSELQLDNLGL